jgi:L-ascorbate metabolism protein UlaG (beta-lactamase superfamily)
VHDPWLNGPEVQVSSWIVFLALSSATAFSNGAGVGRLVLEIESAAADAGVVASSTIQTTDDKSPVDAIFVNLHYRDHLHTPTLLTFPSSVPVFTTLEGALTIKKLNHFDTITTYTDLELDTFTSD